MSTTYNLEPPPTAKVLLQTTAGDVLFELFAKQTPLASRNFLQLCLDGYYDNTIFHRVVPGFIIQGGDPTGTGSGGEAIYSGGLFADEFHSRLKFNRRGLLGMANSDKKDDNGSQFFITLAAAEELTGKNTLFGRVAGDTIYNVMKMAEAELEEDTERPLYPTKITRVEILVNPFDDMVQRQSQPKTIQSEKSKQLTNKKKRKTKAKAANTLLSFGDDEGQEAGAVPAVKKAKFNTNLVKADPRRPTSSSPSSRPLTAKQQTSPRYSASDLPPPKIPSKHSQLPLPDPEVPSRATSKPVSRSPSPSPPPLSPSSRLSRTNAEIAVLKASMKRNVAAAADSNRKMSALEQMIPASATRGRKRKHDNSSNSGPSKEEMQTLALLDEFKSKLENAKPRSTTPHSTSNTGKVEDIKDGIDAQAPSNDKPQSGIETEEVLCDLHFIPNCQSCQKWEEHNDQETEDNPSDLSWMAHALTFEKDRLGKDLEWKRKNEEELVVIDPREKEKQVIGKNKKGRGEKRSREWDRRKMQDHGGEPSRI